MARIIIFRPTSLPNYMQTVQDLQRRAGHALWFRGSGNIAHALEPSLYRHPTSKKPLELQLLERQLMTRFRQRSLPYHSRNLSDDWEALFFMQHYGVPTRLLDWTENSLVALHFALMSSSIGGRSGKPKTAIIWVLNPHLWNERSLQHLSYQGGPLAPGDAGLKGYAPADLPGVVADFPVCLYGAYNSPRIAAQQGVFTIFGTSGDSMQSLVKNGTFPLKAFSGIAIHPSRISRMRTALLNQGITESVVFPDLEGLARETKRHFGFKVR